MELARNRNTKMRQNHPKLGENGASDQNMGQIGKSWPKPAWFKVAQTCIKQSKHLGGKHFLGRKILDPGDVHILGGFTHPGVKWWVETPLGGGSDKLNESTVQTPLQSRHGRLAWWWTPVPLSLWPLCHRGHLSAAGPGFGSGCPWLVVGGRSLYPGCRSPMGGEAGFARSALKTKEPN